MRRTSRRFVAIVTLFGLLLVQGSVAAYACTTMFNPLGGLVPAASAGPATDCASMMAMAEAGLCLQHCTQGDDANSTVPAVDVPGPALRGFLCVALAPAAGTVTHRVAARPVARSTSPPPLLLSQRLRI